MTAVVEPGATTGHQLRRTVGFWGLTFVSLGSIIGSGWLLGALTAAGIAGGGGSLVAWRGRRDTVDEAAAARAALGLGLELRPPVAVHPYPAAEHRHLHVLVKVGETPPKFPRRPGVAQKHPLGR